MSCQVAQVCHTPSTPPSSKKGAEKMKNSDGAKNNGIMSHRYNDMSHFVPRMTIGSDKNWVSNNLCTT
jgi:hypothetical protein